MAIRRKRIRELADTLLSANGIQEPAVPIELVVASQGLVLRKRRNEESTISGFLARQGETPVIGVNAAHSHTRQRFTIAHELGHFLLHEKDAEQLHVDRSFPIRFRDEHSAEGVDPDEQEANLFAAELLMPQRFLEKDLEDVKEIDRESDEQILRLVRRYGVSMQAMLFRLANLKYLRL